MQPAAKASAIRKSSGEKFNMSSNDLRNGNKFSGHFVMFNVLYKIILL
jgi:hypothetical protein